MVAPERSGGAGERETPSTELQCPLCGNTSWEIALRGSCSIRIAPG